MKKKTLKAGGAYERFVAMTPDQRRADVARFEREDLNPGRPLTAADKALHRRARVGRPRVGQGIKIVPVSIERGLLKAADEFARRHKLKRSQLVARGLELAMRESA